MSVDSEQSDGRISSANVGDEYKSRIAKLRYVLYGLTVFFAAVSTFVSGLDFHSPIEPLILYAASAAPALSALVSKVLEERSEGISTRFVFYFLIALNVAFLVIVVLLWQTQTYDVPITEDESIEAEIPADSEETFGFTVEPGAFVVLRIFALASDVDITASVLNEEYKVPVEKVQDRLWELQTVLPGGYVTLSVTDNTGSEARTRIRYSISRSARSLSLDSPITNQVIAHTGDMASFVAIPDSDVEVDLVATDLSPEGLPLAFSVFSGTSLVSSPATLLGGVYSTPLTLFQGNTYIVAVDGLDEAVGRFTIALRSVGLPPPSSATTTSPPVDLVALPVLYNIGEAEAHSSLASVGFVPVSIAVCSGSVDAGRVRQAFIENDDGTESIVADRPGVTSDNIELPSGTVVQLKISNGNPCS